jgi:tetratricopeptide (TPR) repeat protein
MLATRLMLTTIQGSMSALCLLVVAICGPSLNAAPADSAEYFAENYGLADRSEPLIARAYAVFARMKSAAALPGHKSPELYVVDSPSDPWAQALPDGNVILSKGAVDICYREADQIIGDARLAFVLGHELAHLAKDDFWHTQVHRALAGEPGTESVRALLEETSDADPARYAETRAKEAQADDWGVLYAGLAGYPVDELLGDGEGRQGFFHFWLAQTHTRAENDPLHPLPEDRAVLIRARLSEVIGDLEYYRFGVRLMSLERFEEARHFLEAFENSFPAPEVLGNLGYLNLRLSMQAMPAQLAYRYWMPTLFDVTSRADRLSVPGRGEELPPEARSLLDRAVEYFEKATATDAAYAPAWVNLAIARFYLAEMSLAMHATGKALELRPGDADLLALQSVVTANLDPALDTWPQAVARLEALVTDGRANAAVRYDLARLLEEHGRGGEANAQWGWLRANASTLPTPYRLQVCADETGSCALPEAAAVAPSWPVPVAVGVDLFEHAETRALLNGDDWQQEAFDFQRRGMNGNLYWRVGEAAVLDLDGYVEIVALYGSRLGTAESLVERFGNAIATQQVQGGELWNYGHWMAVVTDERIKEVWLVHDET